MIENYERYGLNPEEVKVLLELEELIGNPIPYEDIIERETFGFKIEGNNVIGLGLYYCELTTLPESIGKLNSLQMLYLTHNELTTLPESIGNLKSLKILYLYENRLDALPESIGNLYSLQQLDLTDNKFTTFPEPIQNLKSLQILNLSWNQLTTIPQSIGNLISLQELSLGKNKLINLPESILNLTSLRKLDLYNNQLINLPESIKELNSLTELVLTDNDFKTFPESIIELNSLQNLNLSWNQIKFLPQSIEKLKSLKILYYANNGLTKFPDSVLNLKSLEEISLYGNQLTNLPESISNLKSLKILILDRNQILTLPDSIGDLSKLQELYLEENQLIDLPESMWRLKNLKKIKLANNKWEGEWKDIVTRDASSLLDYCRQKASINIFISHAVADFNIYRVKEISEFLEQQEEIYQAFYCEEDLKGNIDDFMNETVPKCQLLLFIASHKSIFESQDCTHELELAHNNNIQIIPIKGEDVDWGDLVKVGLSRQLGFEFEAKKFEIFCEKLYEYIRQFKRDIHLFEHEQAKIDRQKLNIKNTINNFFDSTEFTECLKNKLEQFEELFQKISDNQISIEEYIQRWAQILIKKSNSF